MTLIEQSLVQYQTIAEQLNMIEDSLHGLNSDAIIALSKELLRLQEQVKAIDIALLETIESDPSFREEPQLIVLLDLMRFIHRHNHRVTAQLRSIMVVHRDELLKIKKGNIALQGYRPASDRTGGRICIAN